MSAMADPHTVLGVPRGASLQEIKVAYRSMAMQCHPDRNTGSNAAVQFKAASEVRPLARHLLTHNLHYPPLPCHLHVLNVHTALN